MIKLGAALLAEIERHAEREYPRECCGLLVGLITDDGRTRIIHATQAVENVFAEEGERHHRMAIEPLEYARAERRYAAEGLGVVGNYHSHPDHPAIPSERDRVGAQGVGGGTSFSFLIQSVRAGQAAELTSWLLAEGGERFVAEELA